MADVARLMPLLEFDQHRLAVAGALLLFIVFGIKAAMLPVGLWLPKTYAVATTPVASAVYHHDQSRYLRHYSC